MYDAKSTFFVSFEHFWADFVPVPVRYLSGGLSSPGPSSETPSNANILTLGPQNWLKIKKIDDFRKMRENSDISPSKTTFSTRFLRDPTFSVRKHLKEIHESFELAGKRACARLRSGSLGVLGENRENASFEGHSL